jgi:hypothetical protein
VIGLRTPVDTVIVATRFSAAEFVLKLAVIVPFPLPEGVTEHQVWLLETFQVLFEVTVNVHVP